MRINNKILEKTQLSERCFEFKVLSEDISASCEPGQFVLVMPDEKGERIPLTIADFDRKNSTVTIVLIVVGTSTFKLSKFEKNQSFYALIGPLGNPSKIDKVDSVVFIGGGLGIAPIYPIARAYRQNYSDTTITTIIGARNKSLLFWEDKLDQVSDKLISTTDDGSSGTKGLVTLPLENILKESKVNLVYAIGPLFMMKACSDVSLKYNVKTVVSLNSLMIDGTGMCGGCRVLVDNQVKFTCVDGPEFDAHKVDWDVSFLRSKMFKEEEKCSYDLIVEKSLKELNKQ